MGKMQGTVNMSYKVKWTSTYVLDIKQTSVKHKIKLFVTIFS